MTISHQTTSTPNHEYSRGLPQGPKNWRRPGDGNQFKTPGDLDTERDRRAVLSRFDTMPMSTNGSIDLANLHSISAIPDPSHDTASNINWLNTVTNRNCLPNVVDLSRGGEPPADWAYQQRREAQDILPFLYLGPMNVAKDGEFLKKAGITMLLIANDPNVLPAKYFNADLAAQLGIEVQNLDFDTNRVIAKFDEAVTKINTHLLRQFTTQQATNQLRTQAGQPLDHSLPARILVYDLDGNSESAIFIAAYIAAMYECKPHETTFVMHAKRFCVNAQKIQDFMVRWCDIVDARKQTHRNTTIMPSPNETRAQPAPALHGKKRGMDVDEENDDHSRFYVHAIGPDANNTDDQVRRQISAPFVDRNGDQTMDVA